jgi:hypothetical protein
MLEWIRNLQPEFVILFGFNLIVLIFLVVSLMKSQRILDLIGKRALMLKEDLIQRDGLDFIDITIANSSYVNVEAGSVGYKYEKVMMPISESSILIVARDSYKVSMPVEKLRTFIIGHQKKIKKIYFYVEDSLGRKTVKKAKHATKIIKETLNAEKLEAKKAAKKLRFEAGKYNFIERTGLVFSFIFSPITKLYTMIQRGVNKRLKRREVRLEIKAKENKHKDEMQEVFNEQRREEILLQTEKRILEDKKIKLAELRSTVLKRREEMQKVQEEMKKIDREIGKENQVNEQEKTVIKKENKKEVKPVNEMVEKPVEKQTEVVGENVELKDKVNEENIVLESSTEEKKETETPKKTPSKKKKTTEEK